MASPTNVEVDGSSGTVEIALGKHSNLSSIDPNIGTHDYTEEPSPVYYSVAARPRVHLLLASQADEHKSPLTMQLIAPHRVQHEVQYGDGNNRDEKATSDHVSSKKDLNVSNYISPLPTLPSSPTSSPSQPSVHEGPELVYTIKRGGKSETRVITNAIPLINRLANVVTSGTQFLAPEREVAPHLTSLKPSKPLLPTRNVVFLQQWNQFTNGGGGSPGPDLQAPTDDMNEDSESSPVSDFIPLTPEQLRIPLMPSPTIISRRSPSMRRARAIDPDRSPLYASDPFAADSVMSSYFSPDRSPDMDLTPKTNQSSALKDHVYAEPSELPMLLEFPSLPSMAPPHSGEVATPQAHSAHPKWHRFECTPKRSHFGTPGSGAAFAYSNRNVTVRLDDPTPTPLPATGVHFGRNRTDPTIPKRGESLNVTTRGRFNTTANDQALINNKESFLVNFPVIDIPTTLSAGVPIPNTASASKAPVAGSTPLWRRRAASGLVQEKAPPGKEKMSEASTWLFIPIHSADNDEDEDEDNDSDDDDDDDLFDHLATPKASDYERRRHSPENIFIFGPPPVPTVGTAQGPGRNPQATGQTDFHAVTGGTISSTSVMDLITLFPQPPQRPPPALAPAFMSQKDIAHQGLPTAHKG